jgi:hypothetical protein
MQLMAVGPVEVVHAVHRDDEDDRNGSGAMNEGQVLGAAHTLPPGACAVGLDA